MHRSGWFKWSTIILLITVLPTALIIPDWILLVILPASAARFFIATMRLFCAPEKWSDVFLMRGQVRRRMSIIILPEPLDQGKMKGGRMPG
jgi:hypothetical protein